MEEVEKFVDEWLEDSSGIKPVFVSFYEGIAEFDDVRLDFNKRPGVSYSLRARHKNQKERPLFVMLDVIDDDPPHRWLSVCFYGDMIADPEELGDLIPGGLLGADGYCFDIADSDASLAAYVGQRIREAYDAAGRGN
jgi:hypothetical protein